MSTRQLKLANLLIWSGVLLLLAGILCSYSTFSPYFATPARTSEIPTAPPLDPALSAGDGDTLNLLPFEGEEERYTSLGAALEPDPDTPVALVPIPSPTTLPTLLPPAATPVPTPTPLPVGSLPVLLRIPAINLESPVVPIAMDTVQTEVGPQLTWQVPDWKAVGWHHTSALLGVPGNTVLNGHNTTRGEVFCDLYQLEPGAGILVAGENGKTYTYKVAIQYILAEAGQSLAVRQENARYIQPTVDERLTLVTCHPYASTRYRLITIAYPASPDLLETVQ